MPPSPVITSREIEGCGREVNTTPAPEAASPGLAQGAPPKGAIASIASGRMS